MEEFFCVIVAACEQIGLVKGVGGVALFFLHNATS